MKINKTKFLLLLIGLLIIGFIAGCNILSWSNKISSDTSDIPTLLYEANNAVESRDYPKAMEYYLKVISIDPKNSKARYGYSSACIQNTGSGLLSLVKIANLISSSQNSNNPNPFETELKNLEIAVASVIDYVDPIAEGQCDGVISKDNFDININLSFAYILKTIFVLIDPPNGNSGKMRFNFLDWSDQSWDIVISDLSSIKTVDDLPNVVLAATCIDKAVTRLDTALQSYNSPDPKIQAMANTIRDIKNYIQTFKTELAKIEKQINNLKQQYGIP
jgi:hypothetical protein